MKLNRSFSYTAESEADTDALAAALADVAPSGCVVSLIGELGAGKTRFVQGFCVRLGITAADVSSPTYVLCQHYDGEKPVHHFDAYRLADEDEFIGLGPEEYFDSAGVTFVEWADRVSAAMPDDAITIRIETVGPDQRVFSATGNDPAAHAVIEAWSQKMIH